MSRDKHRRMGGLAAAALMLSAACCLAQSVPTNDLSLAFDIQPKLEIYPPGTLAQLRFTAANLGPDPAPGAAIGLTPIHIDGFNAQVAVGPSGATPDCGYSVLHFDAFPGFHGAVVPQFELPPIPVGESVTCELALLVLDTGRGTLDLKAVVSRPAAHITIDPESSNDRIAHSLAITPADAPLPETNLSVDLQFVDAPRVLAPGSATDFWISVSNAGPEVAPGATLELEVTTTGGGAYAAGVGSAVWERPNAFCKRITDRDAPDHLSWLARAMQLPFVRPGESIRCKARLHVFDGATGSVQVVGRLVPQADFGLPTLNAELSDNVATFVVSTGIAAVRPAQMVPALGTWMLGALAALLALGTLGRISPRR